jgi:hypothetical protein
MQTSRQYLKIEPVNWIIITAAAIKFALQVYIAPGYGYFGDELYTMALSRHLAFGYVDLPPLVPALMATSRALLGESMLEFHVVPALAGAIMLVCICLITRHLGGGWFAVLTSALLCIGVPVWLGLDSIFCYDSIDQMILAIFLYTLVRFLKNGNVRLWLLLGLIAGIACMTKMTMLFLGPGFLVALLLSKYRKYLLTPWPYLGGLICLIVVSPYIIWQINTHWPTIDYWTGYGTMRVYKADIPQYLTNIFVYMNPLLLPVWIAGLYRVFRRFNGVNYRFFGYLFMLTLCLLYFFHATPRLFIALFIPIIAAASIWLEEGFASIFWSTGFKIITTLYISAAAILVMPSSMPILPSDKLPEITQSSKQWISMMREFVGGDNNSPFLLSGRLGWEELTKKIAAVYNSLPEEDRKVAGIYTDTYMVAGAIDLYGPKYGVPHAVSGSLTYYLWGPGYTWDVMIIVVGGSNTVSMFFDDCKQEKIINDREGLDFYKPHVYVCRKPKVGADQIWSTMKQYR